MPELPEVEVARRGIAARLHGARVLAVRCGKPLRWPLGCAPESLLGSRLGEITRRGKYLWLPLRRDASAAAGADGGLLLHLGMSGSLALHDAPPEAAAHAHFDLTTSQGTLRLTDPRRFGAVVWSSAIDAAPAAALLSRLGAEPFDPAFTAHSLYAACRRRKTSIKALLLGGQAINMSVSIGVATRDTVMSEPEALIKRADQALYLAKNKGRNRIMTAQSLRPGPIVPPR